jgi:hypothetical protein
MCRQVLPDFELECCAKKKDEDFHMTCENQRKRFLYIYLRISGNIEVTT